MCQALPMTWPWGGDRPGFLWVTSSHPRVIQPGWPPRSTCGLGMWVSEDLCGSHSAGSQRKPVQDLGKPEVGALGTGMCTILRNEVRAQVTQG